MKVKVILPYPLPLVSGGDLKLVAFVEKPPKIIMTENPWKYLDWRGFAILKRDEVLKQLVIRSKITILLRAFEPRGLKGNPIEAFNALLEGKAPCPELNGFWACGDTLVRLGNATVKPMGFGIMKTRLSFIGPKMRLDVV